MKLTSIVLATLALAGIASAKAEPITLTVEQAVQCAQGLMSLDKYTDDKGKERPFTFSGDIRFNIAKDIIRLNETTKAFNDARSVMIAGAGKVEPNSPEANKLTDDIKKILAQAQPMDLIKLKKSDLYLDVNPIPPTTIALLMPLIDE